MSERASPAPVAPSAGGPSDFGLGRVLAVLWRPRDTFQAIASRPTWAAALLVVIAAAAIATALAVPRIDVGDMIRGRLADSGQSMSSEQLDSVVEMVDRLRWPMFLGPVVVFQPIFVAAVALVFYLLFRVTGSTQTYRQSFAVTVHAFLPHAVAALLSVPLLVGRDTIGVEELMGGGVLASNLGALAPEDGSAAVGALLGSLDFFTLWTLVLMIIGYRQSSRASNPTVVAAVLSLWALTVLARVGLAAVAFGASLGS